MKPPSLAQFFSRTSQLDSHAPDPSLSPFESHLVSIAHARWPTSSLEIAEFLGHPTHTREEKRTLSSRIAYHVKKLIEKKKLMSKRMGNALIVWPYDVECLRTAHAKQHPTASPPIPRGVN